MLNPQCLLSLVPPWYIQSRQLVQPQLKRPFPRSAVSIFALSLIFDNTKNYLLVGIFVCLCSMEVGDWPQVNCSHIALVSVDNGSWYKTHFGRASSRNGHLSDLAIAKQNLTTMSEVRNNNNNNYNNNNQEKRYSVTKITARRGWAIDQIRFEYR